MLNIFIEVESCMVVGFRGAFKTLHTVYVKGIKFIYFIFDTNLYIL